MHTPLACDDRSSGCGVVYKKTIGNYYVYTDGRSLPCALSSRLRKQLIYPTADPHSARHAVQQIRAIEHVDPIAIGDTVRFIDAQDGTGLIVEILPRRNKLARQAATPGARVFEQVIAANVDQVIPVFAAAQPAPKWNLLDRYLVSAEAAGLPAVICITKLDLVEERASREEIDEAVEDYRHIGYPVILTSVGTGEGLADLKQVLQGRISVLLGKSGVGKTSLLNALQPGLGLRVNAVSQATGKGKHTTTHLEMFPLALGNEGNPNGAINDGAIIDTPGVREFGLWDVAEDDLALLYPEMRPYVGCCKFGLDCQHDEEPGCAIRKAVAAGRISPRRYQSLLRLAMEV
jgi:ribosome biogenesis GTPase